MRKKLDLDLTQVRGAEASRLRQRKHVLMGRFHIPDDLLPGTICKVFRRCGNAKCRCVAEGGHETWSWTFMKDGKRHVAHVPADQVEALTQQIEAGREFQDAVREVLTANARLVLLERKQEKARRAKAR